MRARCSGNWTTRADQWTLYSYNRNDSLAAIFEAKLKTAIDNQKAQIFPISKRCFQPYIEYRPSKSHVLILDDTWLTELKGRIYSRVENSV